MQDPKDGYLKELKPGDAEILRRIADAGKIELPIFAVGEPIEIRNAHFRVVAFSGNLLVLAGVPWAQQGRGQKEGP
jgi:hypothetical protein